MVNHCLSRSFSTAPPLASAETGTGVKVGRASEMGFIRRWPPAPAVLPEPAVLRSGTAAERGAKNGFESPVRLPGPETPARAQEALMGTVLPEAHLENLHFVIYLMQAC